MDEQQRHEGWERSSLTVKTESHHLSPLSSAQLSATGVKQSSQWWKLGPAVGRANRLCLKICSCPVSKDQSGKHTANPPSLDKPKMSRAAEYSFLDRAWPRGPERAKLSPCSTSQERRLCRLWSWQQRHLPASWGRATEGSAVLSFAQSHYTGQQRARKCSKLTLCPNTLAHPPKPGWLNC